MACWPPWRDAACDANAQIVCNHDATSDLLRGAIAKKRARLKRAAAAAASVLSNADEKWTDWEQVKRVLQDELDLERSKAIPMLLWCPECHARHIDEGRWQHHLHHTHACQHCGHTWRPAVRATVGVRFLPGFKD